MTLLLSLAILLGIGLAVVVFAVWLFFPFTVSRLLKSIDERLYYQNRHLENIEQLLQAQPRPEPFHISVDKRLSRHSYQPAPPPLPPESAASKFHDCVTSEIRTPDSPSVFRDFNDSTEAQ